MARLLISLWKVQVKQMHIELTVKRQTVPDETSYLQTFSYDGDAALTIADWLTEVNRTEAKTNRIAWECGCLEKKCGACAQLNQWDSTACVQCIFKRCGKAWEDFTRTALKISIGKRFDCR